MATLTFKLNEHLYLRDPQFTALGQSIIKKSVELIDKLGFEDFTFKKLATEMDSTEASVYRYLISWYWNWIEYRCELLSSPNQAPKARLQTFLHVLAEEKKHDSTFDFLNEEALYRIVVCDFDKTYLTKWVDADNEEGLFVGFKSLNNKIVDLLKLVNPQYPFPNSLASTILITSHLQPFFAGHLKSLTNIQTGKDMHNNLYHFLESLAFGPVKK
jgi:hypothetical protein